MHTDINVAPAERWTSSLAGAGLTAIGIRRLADREPVAGAALTAIGGYLLYRGALGHCLVYEATGLRTSHGSNATRDQLSGQRGVNVEETVTINRGQDELYGAWKDFAQLPKFMRNLVSVEPRTNGRSHWVARGPAGKTVEWDAEIINEVPNSLIAWQTTPDSTVVSAGSVHFTQAAGGRGTEVRVRLQYEPPAGKLGSAVAWILGSEPSQTIREDLRRFKQWMETGEIPVSDPRPRGGR
jgi:uncharacterized membrane protein